MHYNRHNEVPAYATYDSEIPANYYNHVQIALKRLEETIRLSIPKLWHLDLILQKDAWIIVDRSLNDLPIAAWTDFEVKDRENIHEPIHCQIRTFHAYARAMLNRTLEAMEMLLGEKLNEAIEDKESNIIEFKNK